jgi:hypothetical protein
MNAFGLDTVTSIVTVDGDSPVATVRVDVTNVLDRHVEAGIEVEGEGALDPAWITVERDRFPLDASENRRVSVRVEPPSDAPPGEHRFRLRVYDVDRPADAFAASPPLTVDIQRRRRPGSPPWLLPVLGLAVVLVIGLGVWRIIGDGSPTSAVPQLENATEQAAREALTSAGLRGNFVTDLADDIELGRVIRTDPPAGTQVAPGSTVVVVVSGGVAVPQPEPDGGLVGTWTQVNWIEEPGPVRLGFTPTEGVLSIADDRTAEWRFAIEDDFLDDESDAASACEGVIDLRDVLTPTRGPDQLLWTANMRSLRIDIGLHFCGRALDPEEGEVVSGFELTLRDDLLEMRNEHGAFIWRRS